MNEKFALTVRPVAFHFKVDDDPDTVCVIQTKPNTYVVSGKSTKRIESEQRLWEFLDATYGQKMWDFLIPSDVVASALAVRGQLMLSVGSTEFEHKLENLREEISYFFYVFSQAISCDVSSKKPIQAVQRTQTQLCSWRMQGSLQDINSGEKSVLVMTATPDPLYTHSWCISPYSTSKTIEQYVKLRNTFEKGLVALSELRRISLVDLRVGSNLV